MHDNHTREREALKQNWRQYLKDGKADLVGHPPIAAIRPVADVADHLYVHKIRVTFFKDKSAATAPTKELTLPELFDIVHKPKRKTKDELPLLKLAGLGTKKSDKGSLRWDGNVRDITGIELDYDGELVSFDDAVKKAKEMGIRCLVYTTPTHTPATPHWRVLVPLSRSEPRLEMRAKYVARVHGFFDCIFARKETFALSQSFYYGQAAEENPDADHKAVILQGRFIDLADDLYKYQAKGEQQEESHAGKTNTGDTKKEGGRGFEAHLKTIGDGPGLKGFNGPLTSATSSYTLHHGAEFDREQLKAILRDAINQAPISPTRKPAEIKRYLGDKYLDALIESAIEKFGHGVTVEDFVSYSPQHFYIFKPVREPWVAAGVNANCAPMPEFKSNGDPKLDKDGNQKFIPANVWIDRNHSVQQMSWLPGAPMEIQNRLIKDGVGWIDRRGVICFNLYLPPSIVPGNAADVGPWLDHGRRIYPADVDHIVRWCAQRVQTPQIKINHALFLGGEQGIGKDTLLEPVKRAVGTHNVQEITAGSVTGRFNGYLKSVILCINEARDLGESDRFKFYEHMKTLAAAPPAVLRVDEKNLKEHYIPNCTGVIITSNHKTDGIYLPPGDRRTYVAWSDCNKEDFSEDYWNQLWNWYDSGGDRNVAAYLATLDLSNFNPKAPPPKTAAFWAIVDANIAPEESELADVLDSLSNPDAVTLDQLVRAAAKAGLHDANEFLCERKNRRAIPHRLEGCGYVAVRNSASAQGLWQIGSRRQAIYAKKALAVRDQIRAARQLIAEVEAAEAAKTGKRQQRQQNQGGGF
jgi:Family of unknown function (DUF5906)